MVILVVSTAFVAAPRVSQGWMQTTALDGDEQNVLQTLRLARETAIHAASDVIVRRIRREHPDGTQRYALELQLAAGPYSDNASWHGAGGNTAARFMDHPFWLRQDVSIQRGPNQFRFQSDGTADRDVSWDISLQGVTRTVNVLGTNGWITRS
ncbi:MAG: hypothetical protein AAGD07_02785 [Planctomycetota bacterium]